MNYMRTYIWSSEYVLYIAMAETVEKAQELMRHEFYSSNRDRYDVEYFEDAMKLPPELIGPYGAIVLEHSNE